VLDAHNTSQNAPADRSCPPPTDRAGKINILRVITWLPLGGIERRLVELLPRLDRERFAITLCCLREKGPLAARLEAAGIRVVCIPMRSRLAPRGLRNLAHLMKDLHIHIVHSHMYRSNVPATIAGRLARVPVIISQIHNVATWETRRQLWMDRFLCRWRDSVVAVSEEVKREIIEKLHVPEERCPVIYNGIALEQFAAQRKDPAALAHLGIHEKNIVLIVVARFVAQKNHAAIVRVAQRLLPRFPHLTFLLVGDGPTRPAIERSVRENALEPHFVFTGRRDDIPQLLALADISLLPSLKEGFSNVIVESMAAGLPVVATRVGGNAEAIEHDRTGILFEPGDDAALEAALTRLITDEPLRRQMGEQSRTRAERFSLDKMARLTEELYLALLERSGNPDPCLHRQASGLARKRAIR
jgi:glycosyltransferase involved in cell wall biosynthesis